MVLHLDRDRMVEFMGLETGCYLSSLGVPVPLRHREFRHTKICSSLEVFGDSPFPEWMGIGFHGNIYSCES